MLFLPPGIVALLTFPGVIIHEWAHKTAAEWRNLQVHDVCYFQLGNPPGYVKHDQPRTYTDAFIVTLAPFFVNTGLALGYVVLAPLIPAPLIVWQVGLVLSVMVAIHALPSKGDGRSLWRYSKEHKTVLTALTFPIVAAVYVADILKVLWIDVVYAIFVVAAGVFFHVTIFP